MVTRACTLSAARWRPAPRTPSARARACAVGAYYFNWYNLEQQWERYSTTRTPVLGHYDQAVRRARGAAHACGAARMQRAAGGRGRGPRRGPARPLTRTAPSRARCAAAARRTPRCS